MNANRMKYASTPTFGMQKRGLLKKPAAQRVLEAPDFSQVPNPANTMPPQQFFSVPQQASFQQQPSAHPGSFYSQAPYFPLNSNTPPVQQIQVPFMTPPFINSNGGMPPFSPMQNQMPTQPTLGNTAPTSNMGGNGFSPRSQGYVLPLQQSQQQMMPSMMQNSASRPAVHPATFSGGQIPPFFPGMQQGVPTGQQNMGFQPAAQPMQQSMGNLPPMYPPPHIAQQNQQRQPMNTNKLWSIFLFGLLPLLFIPCLFVSSNLNFLRYVFFALSMCGLAVMWYRQLFTSSSRLIISVVYIVLCIVTIWIMLQGGWDAQQVGNNLGNQRPGTQATQDPTGGNAAASAPTTTPTETPSPKILGPSEAEQRLSTFMNLWKGNNTPEMVSYVQPSWASAQDTPSQQLFIVLANRTPEEFKIEDVSGTDDDGSRTVTMTATINKNNGKDPVIYRFMVLMVKENGEWFVDPKSLATNDEQKPNDENVVNGAPTAGLATSAPRTTVTPVPPSDTALYYNPDKGSYYHLDANCPGVKAEFLPLAGSFPYSNLGNDENKSLKPCLKCGAPTEKLAIDPPAEN